MDTDKVVEQLMEIIRNYPLSDQPILVKSLERAMREEQAQVIHQAYARASQKFLEGFDDFKTTTCAGMPIYLVDKNGEWENRLVTSMNFDSESNSLFLYVEKVL